MDPGKYWNNRDNSTHVLTLHTQILAFAEHTQILAFAEHQLATIS